MTNSADPDQLASSEANWSGSTLLNAKAGHIQAQQDQGWYKCLIYLCYNLSPFIFIMFDLDTSREEATEKMQ